MPNPAGRTFTCESCGGTFPIDPDWSEEDMLAEAVAAFGSPPPADAPRVCTPCYDAIMSWVARQTELPRAW